MLAPNAFWENAAIGHSQWMLAAGVFSHTGKGGSSPAQRATTAGCKRASIGNDTIWGGDGADRRDGGSGFLDDRVWGAAAWSAQQIVSQFARVVAGNVVFEFSANEVITLNGATTTAGLADGLQII